MRRQILVTAAISALAGGAWGQATVQPEPASAAQPAALGPLESLIARSPPEVRDDVRRFYARRQGAPAWSDAQAADLVAAIQDAPKHGLDPRVYLPSLEGARDAMDRDVRLTAATIAYARVLASGRVNPETVEKVWDLRRNWIDPVGGLDGALRGPGVRAWIESLPPQDLGYQNLSRGYLRYRALSEAGGWPRFTPGEAFGPGAVDARVPALVARLVAEGDLAAPVEGAVYVDALVPAVRAFQTRHGLDATGEVDADTQAALAATVEDRARQIALNLERRRWLPRQVAPERIEVNTAAAIMVYWRDGAPYHASRVVVGTARSQTPSIEKEFSSLVANPPWYVPASIASGELLPREAREPGYLASQGMRLSEGRIIQSPGPGAALGLVKFELIDSYSIYLHDTPLKSVFQSVRRHRSHGCVRVENAVEFARIVMNTELTSLAQYDQAIASGRTERVRLSRSIPVRLLYWTAFVDGQGRVAFRPDVYGRDGALARALGIDVYLPSVPSDYDPTDIGP